MSKQPEPLHLPEAEIKELQARYKQERDRRIAERIQCIMLFAQGYSLKDLKRILCVGVKTLRKWIKIFRTHGLAELCRWGYQGREAELNDEQWAEVEQELASKPYHRAQDVAAFIKERFGITYSKREIGRAHV